jgi:hypothetical protein
MHKTLFVCMVGSAFLLFSGPSFAQRKIPVFPSGSFCDDVNSGLCTELAHNKTYEGKYTGHDEPSLLFYSRTSGKFLTTILASPASAATTIGLR